MKKFLILIVLVGSVTTTASMKAAGSGFMPETTVAADRREARACEVLLRKMSQSPNADTWQNRMRAWPCMQRAETTRASIVEAKR